MSDSKSRAENFLNSLHETRPGTADPAGQPMWSAFAAAGQNAVEAEPPGPQVPDVGPGGDEGDDSPGVEVPDIGRHVNAEGDDSPTEDDSSDDSSDELEVVAEVLEDIAEAVGGAEQADKKSVGAMRDASSKLPPNPSVDELLEVRRDVQRSKKKKKDKEKE